jgi:uncharacterized protein YbjT (DUF2867 family)
MSLIAVTGATGAIGGRVTRALAAQDQDLRLVARDPSRVPDVGAQVAQAEYGDTAALQSAFTGVDTLFFVPATEHPDRVGLHRTVVEAAVAASVPRIVYLSFLAATAEATFTFARDHWATEQLIVDAGVGHTFVRDSLYADFVPALVGEGRAIRGPGGDGAFAPVAQDDVAEVAAAVLTSASYDGATLDLTGPERLTLSGAAELLTEVSGRAVSYEQETIEEAYASRASYGAAAFEVDGWVSTYTAIAAGELDVVSDDVEQVLGRAPLSLRRLLERRPELWQHLA